MIFCLHLFDPKYSKISNIVKYFYHLNNCFLFEYIYYVIHSCNFKAEFLASLVQSHVPSEMILIFWFLLQKHLLFMLKTGFFDK